MKVILILRVIGACRSQVLTDITTDNIEIHENVIIVKLPNTKTKTLFIKANAVMATQERHDSVPIAEVKTQPAQDGKKKPPFQRPRNKVSNKPPQPSRKTTTETQLTNDPLWKESYKIDGETGFVNEVSAKEFNADAAGYVNLVEQEYKAISDVDKYYSKSIPVLGVNGACRSRVLTDITTDNIEIHENVIIVKLPNTKTKTLFIKANAVMATQERHDSVPTAEVKTQPAQDGKKKPPFQRSRNKVSNKPPQPSRKSTTETQLTNDPLWKDSFIIDGETGFVNEVSAKEFNADAAGYVNLVEQEYKAISDVDKYYSNSIPASAHVYYHLVIYWYELALIVQKRGLASQEQDRLVRFVQGYPSIEIAAGAAEYLDGLGDYQDHMGVKHLLAFREPNVQGHFGRATANTHGFYETLPAPTIFYQRVVQDVIASRRGGRANDDWLDATIVPAGPVQALPAPVEVQPRRAREVARAVADAGHDDNPEDEGVDDKFLDPENEDGDDIVVPLPTVNLLGWRPSKTLNANQKTELDAMIDANAPNYGLIIQRYALKRELFELVSRRLRECKRYKTSKIPDNTGGSMVQQVTWKPMEHGDSRFQQFIEFNGTSGSRSNMPLRSAIAAKVMCYRSLRREFEDDNNVVYNTWSCFRFPDHVPANWIANRNVIIQAGNDGLIDYMPFKTQVGPRTDTLIEYLTKFKTI